MDKRGREKNSKFFHATTLNRRRKNKISKSQSQNGEWTVQPKEIISAFTKHFKDIFSSTSPDLMSTEFDLIGEPIIEEENQDIAKVPKEEVIKYVILNMNPLKVPSPNGFPALFY